MEFPVGSNVLLNDPFLSLDTDLDDLTEVIRNQPQSHMDSGVHMMMWEPSSAQSQPSQNSQQQSLLAVNDYGHPQQQQNMVVKSESPDHVFYQKEIGSIVSQLRAPDDDAMPAAPAYRRYRRLQLRKWRCCDWRRRAHAKSS
ncbi:hypothetical protein L596_018796 [Steinernema carpocapsae]|uniref:Uncharacterized protein n=1 Tax=Steinernema carpocapsae TaxID=34508 RepID=A0A4U5N6I6_STECR|nr:hypothetical protein L596_018796 [Steinernema carpocapsae]